MLDLQSNKKILSSLRIGDALKSQSDTVIENTWKRDIQSRQAYIYDYFHDDNKFQYKGYDPSKSENKIPIDIKFIITQYGSVSKDQVEYHIQFKPSVQNKFDIEGEELPLPYFKKDYENKYWVDFPIGLYIDIPNDHGVYYKWMIVGTEKANQFVKYSVLPCNYLFTWIMNDEDGNKKIFEMYGIARLRNSYNSGVWLDRFLIRISPLHSETM